jgi:xylulose-5-phosphate/fructose-6-phosphate phosphoketolase
MEATLAGVNARQTGGVSPSSTHPLSTEERRKIDAYWRACNYLAVGMIYLRDIPLLRDPLKPEHVKRRLLGHWGSSTGLSFTYVHLDRLIKKYDLNAIFLAGPGHGAPGVLGPILRIRTRNTYLRQRVLIPGRYR